METIEELPQWKVDLREKFKTIKVGDKIKFGPHNNGPYWWIVGDRNDRYIVASCQDLHGFDLSLRRIASVWGVTIK